MKIRLDELILKNNLLPSSLILPMVMAGEVWIRDKRATSIAQKVDPSEIIEIRSLRKTKYVGRGGDKLEAAINAFKIDIIDKICADFGASTGGFTDVLIQNGAKKVYAIETGKNVLDQKLRNNPKVINWEEHSLHDVFISQDQEPYNELKNVELSVVDLSFIPLSHSLPSISALTNNSDIVALLKPHYEAQDPTLLENGVIKNENIREQIVNNFKDWAEKEGYTIKGFIESPLKGGRGNVEYLVYLTKSQ